MDKRRACTHSQQTHHTISSIQNIWKFIFMQNKFCESFVLVFLFVFFLRLVVPKSIYLSCSYSFHFVSFVGNLYDESISSNIEYRLIAICMCVDGKCRAICWLCQQLLVAVFITISYDSHRWHIHCNIAKYATGKWNLNEYWLGVLVFWEQFTFMQAARERMSVNRNRKEAV